MRRLALYAACVVATLAGACSREGKERLPPPGQVAAVGVGQGPTGTGGQGGAAGAGGVAGAGGTGGMGGSPSGAGGDSFCDLGGRCGACTTCAIQAPCSGIWIDCQNDLDCSQALLCLQDCYNTCAGAAVCYGSCRDNCSSTEPGHFAAIAALGCICEDICTHDCARDVPTDCVGQL
jgi:hypothetical protein